MIHWSAFVAVFIFWAFREIQVWLREQRHEAARARLEGMLFARSVGELRALEPAPPKPKPTAPDEPRPLRARDQILTGGLSGLRQSSARGSGGSA